MRAKVTSHAKGLVVVLVSSKHTQFYLLAAAGGECGGRGAGVPLGGLGGAEGEEVVEPEGVSLAGGLGLAVGNDEGGVGGGGVAVDVLGDELRLAEGEAAELDHDLLDAHDLLAGPRHEGGRAVDAAALGAVGAEARVVLGEEAAADTVEVQCEV